MSTIYLMRAFKTTPTTGFVQWSVANTPDMTGTYSGYSPSDLKDISVSAVSFTGAGRSNGVNSFNYSIDGYLSLIYSLPAIFDASYVAEVNLTIASVRLNRRHAGTSGTTKINVLVNGASIFSSEPSKPQILYTDGNNATDVKSVFTSPAVTAGQRVEAQLESIEGGDPADIRVTITFA